MASTPADWKVFERVREEGLDVQTVLSALRTDRITVTVKRAGNRHFGFMSDEHLAITRVLEHVLQPMPKSVERKPDYQSGRGDRWVKAYIERDGSLTIRLNEIPESELELQYLAHNLKILLNQAKEKQHADRIALEEDLRRHDTLLNGSQEAKKAR